MAETTLEEAKRCPRCGESGEKHSERPVGGGAKVITFHCKNEGCAWFNTGWGVQINRDGSIPVNDGPGEKQFAMPDWLKNAGRREVEETEFIFGFDRDKDDPNYGKQRSADEIRKEF